MSDPSSVYLLSGAFDYQRLICTDAGPGYASDLGLTAKRWTGEALDPGTTWIVDPWMSEEELAVLERQAEERPDLRLVYRIIDSYPETELAKPIIPAALRQAARAQTRVLFAYVPRELTLLVQQAFRGDRSFVSPYPYVAAEEQAAGGPRQRKVLISGSPNPTLYPLRRFVRHKRGRSLAWRRLSEDLQHPGYDRSKPTRQNGRIGADYLAHLTGFAMMFVCGGRNRHEFLKFRECAYAGCCPVGEAPLGFPATATEALLPITLRSWKQDLARLRAIGAEELTQRATAYRRALSAERQPQRLLGELQSWLAGA